MNITESRVYLRYEHYSKLFRELRKESEFRQRCCRNSNKSMRETEREREKKKGGREKILNFGNLITEIPTAQTC